MISQEMLVVYGEKKSITATSHHLFQAAIMPYIQLHFSSPSASCGAGLSLSISLLLLLCCCHCIFGSSLFSLKCSLCLLFVLGCSAYFLCSSLVSTRLFLPLDLAKIHTTLIFLFLFLFLVVSFWSHPPVLWDILVICGWRYSPSPLASEKC